MSFRTPLPKLEPVREKANEVLQGDIVNNALLQKRQIAEQETIIKKSTMFDEILYNCAGLSDNERHIIRKLGVGIDTTGTQMSILKVLKESSPTRQIYETSTLDEVEMILGEYWAKILVNDIFPSLSGLSLYLGCEVGELWKYAFGNYPFANALRNAIQRIRAVTNDSALANKISVTYQQWLDKTEWGMTEQSKVTVVSQSEQEVNERLAAIEKGLNLYGNNEVVEIEHKTSVKI